MKRNGIFGISKQQEISRTKKQHMEDQFTIRFELAKPPALYGDWYRDWLQQY